MGGLCGMDGVGQRGNAIVKLIQLEAKPKRLELDLNNSYECISVFLKLFLLFHISFNINQYGIYVTKHTVVVSISFYKTGEKQSKYTNKAAAGTVSPGKVKFYLHRESYRVLISSTGDHNYLDVSSPPWVCTHIITQSTEFLAERRLQM